MLHFASIVTFCGVTDDDDDDDDDDGGGGGDGDNLPEGIPEHGMEQVYAFYYSRLSNNLPSDFPLFFFFPLSLSKSKTVVMNGVRAKLVATRYQSV